MFKSFFFFIMNSLYYILQNYENNFFFQGKIFQTFFQENKEIYIYS